MFWFLYVVKFLNWGCSSVVFIMCLMVDVEWVDGFVCGVFFMWLLM